MSSPPPPRYSPDGRWWWDGTQWVPVPAQVAGDAPAVAEAPPGDQPSEQPQPREEAHRGAGAQVQAPTQAPPAETAAQAPAFQPQAPPAQPAESKPQGPTPVVRRRLPMLAWIAIGLAAIIVIGVIGGTGYWYYETRIAGGRAVTDVQARTIAQGAWSAARAAYNSNQPDKLKNSFDGPALVIVRAIVDNKASRGIPDDAVSGPLSVNSVFRSDRGGEFLLEGTVAGGDQHVQLVFTQSAGAWKVVGLDIESYSDFTAPKIKVSSDGTYTPIDGSGLAIPPNQLGSAYARYLTTGLKGSPSGPFADSQYTSGEIESLKTFIANEVNDASVTYVHRGEPPVKIFPLQSGALVMFGFNSTRTDVPKKECLAFNQPGGRFPSMRFKKAVLQYRGTAFATVPTQGGRVTVEGLDQEADTVVATPC